MCRRSCRKRSSRSESVGGRAGYFVIATGRLRGVPIYCERSSFAQFFAYVNASAAGALTAHVVKPETKWIGKKAKKEL